jgi:hypothetical protein
MFSSLLESAKVRLFQATDAYSRFERTKAVYTTFRQSKEENLYVILLIQFNSLLFMCRVNSHKANYRLSTV